MDKIVGRYAIEGTVEIYELYDETDDLHCIFICSVRSYAELKPAADAYRKVCPDCVLRAYKLTRL